MSNLFQLKRSQSKTKSRSLAIETFRFLKMAWLKGKYIYIETIYLFDLQRGMSRLEAIEIRQFGLRKVVLALFRGSGGFSDTKFCGQVDADRAADCFFCRALDHFPE